MRNEMRIEFDAKSVNEGFARVAVAAFLTQLDPTLDEVADVKTAEEVVIFGRQGKKEIPVEEIAAQSHSFNYEFVCSVSQRVPRKYVEED